MPESVTKKLPDNGRHLKYRPGHAIGAAAAPSSLSTIPAGVMHCKIIAWY